MSKNVSDETKASPMYRQQKIMLYIIPFAFLFSGFTFPLALNIYWFTSNLWTMGPVSYTHLDVYKRQRMLSLTLSRNGRRPVSYTHLDVYKRQCVHNGRVIATTKKLPDLGKRKRS